MGDDPDRRSHRRTNKRSRCRINENIFGSAGETRIRSGPTAKCSLDQLKSADASPEACWNARPFAALANLRSPTHHTRNAHLSRRASRVGSGAPTPAQPEEALGGACYKFFPAVVRSKTRARCVTSGISIVRVGAPLLVTIWVANKLRKE